MSGVSIETTQNVSLNYNVASVGDRILEGLIDMVILFGYLIGMTMVLGSLKVFQHFNSGKVVIIVIIALPFLFYSLLCEIFMNGQTFGKRALKTKVVRLDGSQPGIGDYLLRWLFRLVDVWFMSCAVGIVTMLVSQKGQRLGDIVAGTTVIKTGRMISLSDTILSEEAINYTPVFLQASKLTDDQAGLIREVLNAYYRDNNYLAVEALNRKLKEMLDIDTKMPPLEFLNTILKDYAQLTDNIHILSRRYTA